MVCSFFFFSKAKFRLQDRNIWAGGQPGIVGSSMGFIAVMHTQKKNGILYEKEQEKCHLKEVSKLPEIHIWAKVLGT